MNELREVLEDCLQIAAEVHRKYFLRIGQDDVEWKDAQGYDLLTVADKETENAVVTRILRTFPDHGIFAEESGRRESASGVRWLIDPIDGTTNFAHQMPIFCIALGVEIDGVVVLGAVQNAIQSETFRAEKGRGATLNERPIRVSRTQPLSKSLLITGFPYDRRVRADHYLAQYKQFNQISHGILRLGSAALDLCAVAAGRAEAYYEENLNLWDWAAAALIVREAGGRTTDYHGTDQIFQRRQILASNGLIHEEMLKILQPTVSA